MPRQVVHKGCIRQQIVDFLPDKLSYDFITLLNFTTQLRATIEQRNNVFDVVMPVVTVTPSVEGLELCCDKQRSRYYIDRLSILKFVLAGILSR